MQILWQNAQETTLPLTPPFTTPPTSEEIQGKFNAIQSEIYRITHTQS